MSNFLFQNSSSCTGYSSKLFEIPPRTHVTYDFLVRHANEY